MLLLINLANEIISKWGNNLNLLLTEITLVVFLSFKINIYVNIFMCDISVMYISNINNI